MAETKKNIYVKLQEARCLLQKENIKKTGVNNFSHFQYFQLADFLPIINDICLELGLTNLVSFTTEYAKLTVVNSDNPDEQLEFTSPSRPAVIKGAQDIQNLGGEETYQRRYLYFMAYEIVEHDYIEEKTNEPDKEEPKTVPAPTNEPDKEEPKTVPAPTNHGITEKQKKMLFARTKKLNMTTEGIKQWLFDMVGKTSSSELSNDDFQKLIKELDSLEGR